MSSKSQIEWTDATWNPVTGCTKVSTGCKNCYAERLIERFKGKGSFSQVTLHEDRLGHPLRWKRPRRIFVNSMSDLFHEDIPDDFIDRVLAVMLLTPWHTYQVLTKRPLRMRSYFLNSGDPENCWHGRVLHAYRRMLADGTASIAKDCEHQKAQGRSLDALTWGLHDERFLPNVWLGVSIENQETANSRIPLLLETPAAVRFLSCEPLLGPISIYHAIPCGYYCDPPEGEREGTHHCYLANSAAGINWVIVGGESGPGARIMDPEWARSIRDECAAATVPFFFKQWGEWAWTGGPRGRDFERVGKHKTGRLLDGREWNEMPGTL
jgi:protein gp37